MNDRPSTSSNFSEIERLLSSLCTPKPFHSNTKRTEQHAAPPPESNQLETAKPVASQVTTTLSEQWDDLLQSGAATDNDEVMQSKEPLKKKRKTSNRNVHSDTQKKKATAASSSRKAGSQSRKPGTSTKNVVPDDTVSLPDTISEDDDTKGFLEQLKKLTEKKKKFNSQSQAAKLARANKRTITEIENLGDEAKQENQRIAAETSKVIVGHVDPLLAQAQALDVEFQKQAADCTRIKSEAVDSMKQILERSKNINQRMHGVVEQFKARCGAIAEQAEKDIQLEQKRIQQKLRSRAVIDRKLKRLHDVVQTK